MASVVDLFVIEYLSKFELISLSSLMIEHMYKVVNIKEGKYEIPCRYFMNKVFNHFRVIGEKETPGILNRCSLLIL